MEKDEYELKRIGGKEIWLFERELKRERERERDMQEIEFRKSNKIL